MSRISLVACLAGIAVALPPRTAAPQSCDDQSYHFVHKDKHAPETPICGPYPPGVNC